MIWWATEPARARQERAAIVELEARVGWLSNLVWRFDKSLGLFVEFELLLNDRVESFTLKYPEFFPDTPPSVIPHATERLSVHQYGAHGELCLEYRADNWSPQVTGAMMIESAHRLLSAEDEVGVEAVPNAHRTTLGQETRGSRLRLLVVDSFREALAAMPLNTSIPGKLMEHRHAGSWVALPIALGEDENRVWERATLRDNANECSFSALRVTTLADFATITDLGELQRALAHVGLPDWTQQSASLYNAFLIISDGIDTVCFLAYGAPSERKLLTYTTVTAPPEQTRLAAEFAALATARVGIVGCGSVGSKVAASLARAGVGKFLLIDPDILFPENLVRNDLDWRAAGLNKASAVKQRLSEINPSAQIAIKEILLGGQESSGATAAALSALGNCDLIIDASGAPAVFNLCAAVARANSKPLAWALVFAGGIGGLVARARPGFDPIPVAARNQIRLWYAERAIPWEIEERAGYEGADAEGAPLIASDADVSVVAAHLSRFAIDMLTAPNASAFPHSAYAIGLSSEWIFSAPFDTWPITFTPEGVWGIEESDQRSDEVSAFLSEIFPEASEEKNAS